VGPAALLFRATYDRLPGRGGAFDLVRVVDLTTPIPDGSGTFTGISSRLALSGGNVAFTGEGGSDQHGIYLFNGINLVRVADRTTPIPGGSGTFIFLSTPVVSGRNVAFDGDGKFGGGASTSSTAPVSSASPTGPPRSRVAAKPS
jgi:hypothetical protein